MIRKRFEASLFQRFDDAPIRLAREQRRRALHNGQPLLAEMLGHQPVKSRGIQFPQRVVRGIREIHHNKIEHFLVAVQPRKGVAVDDMDARIGK